MKRSRIKTFLTFLFLWCFEAFGISAAFANNLIISNVSLEDRDASLNTAIVEFDISWANSWRDTTNHDAVWVFLKVTKDSAASYQHGMLTGYNDADSTGAVNPFKMSPGSNKGLEVFVPDDGTGAFIRRKATGSGSIASKDVRLKLQYDASPLSAGDTDSLTVKVYGIEMAFIPSEPFRAGDTSGGTSAFKQSSADTDPWYIDSEATISVTAVANNTYYYVNAAGSGEDVTGARFTIPAAFPKGYAAFYCMKYEVTEGQWVDFVNTLLAPQQSTRDITAATNSGKATDNVVYRNTVSFTNATTATSGTATTARPDRAVNYLSWMDLCAFLDWAALRPMTELEYEKVCRGPAIQVSGEFAWGTASQTDATTISISPELGMETITDVGANAYLWTGAAFIGGDAYLGTNHTGGPLRVGIFATSSSTRATSGAGYYGVMELTGNLWERTVTVGNPTGRLFTGAHGDGVVTTTSGYEGNADTANWPKIDATDTARGVTTSTGGGRKGGSFGWNSFTVSERGNGAANVNDERDEEYGGRGVRTYDEP